MSRRSPVVLALVVAILVLAACTPDDTGGAPEPYTKTVGTAGGTIADPGGAILTVPAGALAGDTKITVTTFQDTVDLGTAFTALAGAVCGVTLEPDGLTFSSPVGLRITPLHALEPGGSYPIFYFDAESGKWEQTGTAEASEDGTYLEAQISHFSSYSVFDMPYGVLDDFVSYAEQYAVDFPEEVPASYGELYAACVVFEEESFLGPDQYYNGCCYMRAKGVVDIDYSWDGESYSYQGEYPGYETATSYVLTYAGSGEHVSYTIELEVYLDCSEAESLFMVSAYESALKKGESTEVTATFECGSEPVPDRVVTFSLSGVGKLSGQTALTDEDGKATVTYSATADGTAEVEASLDGCSCENAFQDHDSATITVGDAEVWTGTLSYTFHQGTDTWSEDAAYEVTFNFTVSDTDPPLITGVATGSQDVTVWIDPATGNRVEDLVAPSLLDLEVAGYFVEGAPVVLFQKADVRPLFTYSYANDLGSYPFFGLGALILGATDDTSGFALEEGTHTGEYTMGDYDSTSYTITLERGGGE